MTMMDSPPPATAAEAADSQPATDGPMGLAAVPCSDDSLSSRWTEEQRERARNIVNDIAEDIDNGESREVLREALAIYADFLWDSHQFKGDTLLEKTLVALQALERTKSAEVAGEATTSNNLMSTTDYLRAGASSSLVQRLRAGHMPRPADSEILMEAAADKIEQLSTIAHALMRTCYDEANRLANHGSTGLETLVMKQLYDAANDAKPDLHNAELTHPESKP